MNPMDLDIDGNHKLLRDVKHSPNEIVNDDEEAEGLSEMLVYIIYILLTRL